MSDIGEFAQQAAEQFCQSQEGFRHTYEGRFYLDLAAPVVEEYVKAVFYASMIPDEGRYPTVCLMSYRRDAGSALTFPYCTPVSPTAPEIAKLAHAVVPGNHLCVLSDNGKLLLGGIHVTFLDEMRHLGYASLKSTNPLKMVIRGPGHVEVSNGGIALIYKGGEISEARLLQHADVMEALAQSVTAELYGQTHGTIESLEDIFNDLVEAIVRSGHGGMLIVAKRRDPGQFTALRPVKAPLLRDLLVRYWDSVRALISAAGGLGNLNDERVRQAVSPQSLTVASKELSQNNLNSWS